MTLSDDEAYVPFEPATLEVIQASHYEIIFHSREHLIGKYQAALNVENIDFTSILNVMLTDEIEQRAKVFMDTLTVTYIDYSRRVLLEVNQNTLDNIQRQIDTVRRFIEVSKQSVLALESYLSKSVDDRVLPPYFYIEKSDGYLAESIAKLRSKQTNLEI
ncbi:MAG: hypothetical protein IPG07_03260 [Crocinitomicaceae bacterium]|nr:hypothetical protein [Crocinitomicaceae bacterium]